MFFCSKPTDASQQTGDEPGTSSNQQASSAGNRRAESWPESIDSRSVYGGGRHALRDDDEEDENIANRIFVSRIFSSTPCCQPKSSIKRLRGAEDDADL